MWTAPNEDDYAAEGEIEAGAEVLLNRLERIRRLLWFAAPSVVVENEIRRLSEEHGVFAAGRRVLN